MRMPENSLWILVAFAFGTLGVILVTVNFDMLTALCPAEGLFILGALIASLLLSLVFPAIRQVLER